MSNGDRRAQLFSIRLSLVIGVLMLMAKWYAYAITGSAAILSDAAESVVHVVAVGFAAFSMWLVHQPPDRSHPYGHDKVSYFSAGVEGFLIVLAAGYIIVESVTRLIAGVTIQHVDAGLYVTFGASVVNLALGLYLVWHGKREGSLILIANGRHVLTDSWTSFGVVGGLALVWWTGWLLFDPLFAIAVALNIVWSGWKLLRQSIGGLMDEINPDLERLIRGVLDKETAGRGLHYHELRFRESGNAVWVEYHLLFREDARLSDAHRSATEIEGALTHALGRPATIVSHLEPTMGHDEVHRDILQK